MRQLDNKVALVTGATGGIGQSLAIGLAQAGAKVVISGRRDKEGEETIAMIRDAGGEGAFINTDVSKADQVQRMVDFAVEKYGRLDAAVNNAGVAGGGPRLAELTEEDYDFIFNINVRGLWLCMQAEIRQMLKQGGGSIINVSSVQGHVALGFTAHYTAAKHAVEGYTKAGAVDYARKNIRINAIAPGFVETPMMPKEETPYEKSIISRHMAGRIAKPEDLIGATVFLASDDSKFIHGVSLPIDGGLLAH